MPGKNGDPKRFKVGVRQMPLVSALQKYFSDRNSMQGSETKQSAAAAGDNTKAGPLLKTKSTSGNLKLVPGGATPLVPQKRVGDPIAMPDEQPTPRPGAASGKSGSSSTASGSSRGREKL